MLALDLVGVEVDVAANHVEGRVAEDPLEAEQVAAVEQVELGERVPEGVGIGPHAVEPGPPAEPAQGMLDRSRGERPPVAGEEDMIDVASDRPRPAVGEVVRQAGLGHGGQPYARCNSRLLAHPSN